MRVTKAHFSFLRFRMKRPFQLLDEDMGWYELGEVNFRKCVERVVIIKLVYLEQAGKCERIDSQKGITGTGTAGVIVIWNGMVITWHVMGLISGPIAVCRVTMEVRGIRWLCCLSVMAEGVHGNSGYHHNHDNRCEFDNHLSEHRNFFDNLTDAD
jgi:hypothetical protein